MIFMDRAGRLLSPGCAERQGIVQPDDQVPEPSISTVVVKPARGSGVRPASPRPPAMLVERFIRIATKRRLSCRVEAPVPPPDSQLYPS